MKASRSPLFRSNKQKLLSATIFGLLIAGFLAIFAPSVFASGPSYQTTVCLLNSVYSCTATFHSGVASGDFIVVASSVNWFANTPADVQTCAQNLGAYSYSGNATGSFTVSSPTIVAGGFHSSGGFGGGPYNAQCGVSYQAYATVTQAGTHGASITYGQAWTENLNNVGSANFYDVTGCANITCAFQTLGLNNTVLATTTQTTTINTMCGNCNGNGGNNGTGNYLTGTAGASTLYFYYSQNVNTVGTIDNVTVFVKNVHITTNTGTFYFLFYSTFNSQPPGPGNQWQLLSGNTVAFTLINSTSNFYIHTNPQTFVGAGNWFAVAIMATTTASRGSGASGSGVSLAMVSQPTTTEYQYTVGSSNPPPTFFSSTPKTSSHWDWIFYHIIFPVTIRTQTVTSTTTQGGTATTTVTSTATTLDITTAPGAFTNYAELLIVILTPAMIIAVPIAAYTRSTQGAGIGFVAGLMIGSGLGVESALVPPVFLGIMVIVGVFMIVGLSRSGGGTI